MTDILLKYLQRTYQDINGIQHADISIYEANERINFGLFHIEYQNMLQIISIEQIKDAASKAFTDIEWEFHEKKGLMKNAIKFYKSFEKTGNRDYALFLYQSYYDGHDIEFGELDDQYLHLVVSTGNRGRARLHPMQRKRYAAFIEEIVKESLKR